MPYYEKTKMDTLYDLGHFEGIVLDVAHENFMHLKDFRYGREARLTHINWNRTITTFDMHVVFASVWLSFLLLYAGLVLVFLFFLLFH